MNWEEIDIFKGINLNDSFVLSWRQKENDLVFNIEASIWPESEYYEKPNENEYTCYKPAELTIKNAKEINGLIEMSEAIPSTDKTGEKDYGNIDSFQINNNGFTLEGDFGSVSITGGELYFEIKET